MDDPQYLVTEADDLQDSHQEDGNDSEDGIDQIRDQDRCPVSPCRSRVRAECRTQNMPRPMKEKIDKKTMHRYYAVTTSALFFPDDNFTRSHISWSRVR